MRLRGSLALVAMLALCAAISSRATVARAGTEQPAAQPTIYKWIDENGIAHYTTDRDRIPSTIRDRVESRPTPPPTKSPSVAVQPGREDLMRDAMRTAPAVGAIGAAPQNGAPAVPSLPPPNPNADAPIASGPPPAPVTTVPAAAASIETPAPAKAPEPAAAPTPTPVVEAPTPAAETPAAQAPVIEAPSAPVASAEPAIPAVAAPAPTPPPTPAADEPDASSESTDVAAAPPPPAPLAPVDAKTQAELDELDQKIEAVQGQIGEQEERLAALISTPDDQRTAPLVDDPAFREISQQLPKLQADLQTLRERRNKIQPTASAP